MHYFSINRIEVRKALPASTYLLIIKETVKPVHKVSRWLSVPMTEQQGIL